MAQNLYEPYLLRDSRMIPNDKLKFPVEKGACDNTFATVPANATSSTSIQFTHQLPSESVFVPRKCFMGATIQGSITFANGTVGGGVANGVNAFDIGANLCPQSFPLHRLVTDATIKINDANININMQNYLTPLMQMLDEEDMREYSSHTPVLSDRYANYSDALAQPSSPFAGYQYAVNKYITPRGAHPIRITAVNHQPAGDGSLVKVADGDTWVVTYEIDVVEPILIPPFVWGKDGEHRDAFLGLNKLDIRYNLDASGRRLFSYSLGNMTLVNNITGIANCNLYLQYMMGDATALVKPLVLQDFYSVSDAIQAVNGVNVASGATFNATFPNLQLGRVPNMFIVYARKRFSDLTATDADIVLPISDLRVTFNSRSTLLSGATQDQLYFISKKNGLKNVDWYSFRGLSQTYNAAYNAGANGALNNLRLGGGVMILSPSIDLALSNPYVVNQSGGQYNFQFTCTFTNPTNAQINNVELVVLHLYKNICETSAGYSAIREVVYNMAEVQNVVDSGREGEKVDPSSQDELSGGRMSIKVARGAGRTGGVSRSGGKKLDALLM